MGKGRYEKKSRQLNNAGFTLMEVMVSLAIMVVVAGAVGSFIISGNNSYIRGNNSVTIQEEAQLSVNQIIDLIIDVEKKIDFQVDGNATELRIYNQNKTYMLRWQGDDGSGSADANTIYLYEDGAVTGVAFENVEAYTGYLLAEYVTGFQVDLSELDKNIVGLNMSFVYMDETYQIDETITLRNRLNAAADESLAWITGISISPEVATAKKGEVVAFTYTMTGDEEAIAKGVTWQVKAADGHTLHADTMIDSNGKLVVSANQEDGDAILLVTVTSKADVTKSATAVVTVEKEEEPFDKGDVKIIPHISTLEEYTYTYPWWPYLSIKRQQYVVIFELLPDYADYLNGYPNINWVELTGLSDSSFELVDNPEDYGIESDSKFLIKLVYRGDTTEALTAKVQANVEIEDGVWVQSGIREIDIPKMSDVFIDSDNFVLDRNGIVQLSLKERNSWTGDVSDYNAEDKTITWRVSDAQGLFGTGEPDSRMIGFGEMSDAGGADAYDQVNNVQNLNVTATGTSTELWAKHAIDYNQEYRISVQAVDQDDNVIAETKVFIPRFEVLFMNEEHYMTITKPCYYSRYDIKVYGFNQDPDGDGVNVLRLEFDGYLEGEKEFGQDTQLIYINYGGTGNWVELKVDWQEENEYFALILWDKQRPEAKRSLLFLVE